MDAEKQVVSLELAKRLKEIGIPQESLFYWEQDYETLKWELTSHKEFFEEVSLDNYNERWRGNNPDKWFSAFTVAELGEMLPRCYMSWATPQNGEMQWWCHRMEQHFVTHEETPTFTAETEAGARAKMLIYLTEHQ